jgi:hypothetical protein
MASPSRRSKPLHGERRHNAFRLMSPQPEAWANGNAYPAQRARRAGGEP